MQSAWVKIAKMSFWIGVIGGVLMFLIGFGSGTHKTPAFMGDLLIGSLIAWVAITVCSIPFVACLFVLGKIFSVLFKGFTSTRVAFAKQSEPKKDPRAEEDQRRRDNARANCDILFARHFVEMGSRFTREMYDAFVAQHLGNHRSAEYVERQAAELQEIILQHLQMAEARAAPIVDDVGRVERSAARAAVQSCYDEHAALLVESFPPIRFMAEMKARIPESVSADSAWKQARKMIQDLLVIIAAEKEIREQAEIKSRQQAAAKSQPRRTINPDDLDFS